MQTNIKNARIRAFTDADFDDAHALTKDLKWAHRLDDWRFIHQFGGGLAAELDGQLVGTLLWSSYGDTHAALGLVIVKDALQGRGIGRTLMTTAMADLEGRNIRLNATVEGLPLYEKLGFVASGAITQYQSEQFVSPSDELPSGWEIRAISQSDRPALVEITSDARGYDRSKVVDALLAAGTGIWLERDGEKAGYAFIRPFGKGLAIGPVIASDAQVAKALYSYFLKRHVGEFVRTDIEPASGIGLWLESLGFRNAGSVVAMQYGPLHGAQVNGQEYAVLNQALA